MPLSQEDCRKQAVDRLKSAEGHCGEWHKAARDDFDFVAGNQWTAEDEAILKDQNRPVVVFNYSEKMIDAVCGAEVSNRQEATYKCRTLGMDAVAQTMTAASKWVRDECQAEDEDTDAFRDALICGMGWTEMKMDYSENPDGMPVMPRIDPIEMRWDPAAVKPGLSDRRWDAQGVWMDNDLIKIRWPDAETAGAGDDSEDGNLRHIQQGNRYDPNNQSTNNNQDDKRINQTRVWSYQCCQNEVYYRVDDGSGQIQDVDAKTFGKIRKALDQHGLKYVRAWKKVYYHMFLTDGEDGSVLQFGPLPIQKGFTRHCITGKRDRNKNQWYGLTRVMKDPQRWANKWLSQIMYIINSNAKGGLMGETGAFKDIRKAREDWASPDRIIELNEGGINKIKEKTAAAYPAGLSQLMEFALNSLPQVTGINLEALGLADRDQANVLEQSRKQAAYGLLAPIFDSLRRYRFAQGRMLFYFIQKFISDGRLIRVVGPGTEQVVPLLKAPDAFEFDVVVDQSPNAPDTKTQTWQALMQLVPAALKAGMPVPPQILSYAPIPTSLATEWQQYMEQAKQQQIPPQVQQQMEEMQKQVQQLTQENQAIKQDKQEKIIDAQTKQQQMKFEMMLKEKEVEHDMMMKEMELRAKLGMQAVEIDGKMSLEDQRAKNEAALQEKRVNNDMENSKKSTEGQLRIKAAQSGVKSGKDGTVKMQMDNTEVVDALNKVTTTFSGALEKIVKQMNAPKKVVRDKSGAVVGVKTGEV
jgi:hypothetical protein